jgi:hypothetical protein
MTPIRQYRAGQSIEDHCRSCHEDRTHAVIAVDADGRPIRVLCGFCGSQHNYRGGPRSGNAAPQSPSAARPASPQAKVPDPAKAAPALQRPFPHRSSEPERTRPTMTSMPTSSTDDLERLLRRIVREEAGWTPVEPAEKWRGGELVLKPGKPGLQDKSWPIDAFFHKIVMVRNRLRTLEQQVNASELPEDQKLKLQGYVTGCYGTLTSFNILFADEDDRFSGSGQD